MIRRNSKLVMAMMMVLSVGASAEAAGERYRMLEGTWRVQVTVRNCTTGDALRSAFPALATFAGDGVFVTSDSSFSPALRSPGHGIWSHTRAHSYSAMSEAFLYNASGAMTGIQRLSQIIEMDSSDTFNATVSAEILDPNGNVVGRGCATSVGGRQD